MKSQCRSRGLGLFVLIAFHLSWPRWSAACTNQARRIRYVVRPVVGGDRSVIPALEAAYHRLPADSEFRSHIAKPLAPPVELLLPPLPPIVPTGLSFFSFLFFSFFFVCFCVFFCSPFLSLCLLPAVRPSVVPHYRFCRDTQSAGIAIDGGNCHRTNQAILRWK